MLEKEEFSLVLCVFFFLSFMLKTFSFQMKNCHVSPPPPGSTTSEYITYQIAEKTSTSDAFSYEPLHSQTRSAVYYPFIFSTLQLWLNIVSTFTLFGDNSSERRKTPVLRTNKARRALFTGNRFSFSTTLSFMSTTEEPDEQISSPLRFDIEVILLVKLNDLRHAGTASLRGK